VPFLVTLRRILYQQTLNAPHQLLEMTSDASPFAFASFAADFIFLLKLNSEDVLKLHTNLR